MKVRLSDAELRIMEAVWSGKEPIGFSEIMKYCKARYDSDWKKQTVNTFLQRLVEKGTVQFEERGRKKYYFPLVPREEYMRQWTQEIVGESFGGSLKNFVMAFTGNESLSPKETEELQQLLDEME